MSAPSEPRIEDIPRIAFVTQRFSELQGLNAALLGAGLIVAPLMARHSTDLYLTSSVQALNFAILVVSLPAPYVQRMYRETVGAAVPTTRQGLAGRMSYFAVLAGGLADMCVPIGHGGPSLAAIVLAAWSLWVVARDWRWRIHHLIPAAAGVIAAAITSTAPPLRAFFVLPDPARSATYLLSFTIMGVGILAAGLFDHWLLVSSLAPRALDAPGSGRALARAKSGGRRAGVAAMFCAASGATLLAVRPPAVALVLSMAMMVAAMSTHFLVALFQIARAVYHRALPAPLGAPRLHVTGDSLALMFVVGLSAAIESAVGSLDLTWLAAAIGGASAWVAVRDWPYRGHYLIGAAASIGFLVAAGRLEPAQRLALLICVSTGALALEGLFDLLVATLQRRRGEMPNQGTANVDAI